MTDAEKIAAGLTEAQRKDMLASRDQWWSADGRIARAMQRKGLIGTLDYRDCADFTPLGLAVRATIEREA